VLLAIAGIVLLGLIPVFQNLSKSPGKIYTHKAYKHITSAIRLIILDSSLISDTGLNITERGFTNISVSTDVLGSFSTRSRIFVFCDKKSMLYDFSTFIKLVFFNKLVYF
jgi:hypothetical protein